MDTRTKITRALRANLALPRDHALRLHASCLIRGALREARTQREAAAALGIHEVRLSELLRDYPDINAKR